MDLSTQPKRELPLTTFKKQEKVELFSLITSDDDIGDMEGSDGYSVYDYDNQPADDTSAGGNMIGTC